jgi:hypothetical protein
VVFRYEAVRAFAPNPVSSLWRGSTQLKTHAVASASFSLTLSLEGVQIHSFSDNFLTHFNSNPVITQVHTCQPNTLFQPD